MNELGSIVHGNRDREISDLKLPDHSQKHALQSKSSFCWRYKLEKDSIERKEMSRLKNLNNENGNIGKKVLKIIYKTRLWNWSRYHRHWEKLYFVFTKENNIFVDHQVKKR